MPSSEGIFFCPVSKTVQLHILYLSKRAQILITQTIKGHQDEQE